jgi:hypothetical protein
MKASVAVGGLLLLSTVWPASAWDYASVSSGMTIDQATQALAGQNKRLTLFSERTEQNPGDVYLVEPDSAMLVHVCNGVVNGYSDILPGSIESFVARAASEAKARGIGSTRYLTANEGGHQLNKMVVEWSETDGSQLSLNWSSLNGVNYATIAMKAACTPADKVAKLETSEAPVSTPSATGTVAPKTSAVAPSLSLAQSKCAAKYRSFDPKTGNYRDYSGRYRRCDLLASNARGQASR